MHYYVDEHIKNTNRSFPAQGRADYLRLDMNESTVGLPEEFVRDVLSEIDASFLTMYPEPDRFIKTYADYMGLPVDTINVTNGTDMAIRYLLETFGQPGKEVVTVSPTFAMYWVNCHLLGLKHVPVSYEKDLSLDINKVLSAITDETCVVCLVNPNNPIGNTYTKDEAHAVFERAEQVGAIVIVDEAYHYFTRESLLSEALHYDHVVVLRTFSKMMGMAALRLGVMIGNPTLVGFCKNARLTFDVNAVALLFGERLLQNPYIIDSLIKQASEGKAYIEERLKEEGYAFISCKGNYVLIRPRQNPHTLTERLKEEKKILIYDYQNPFMEAFVRVSTGDIDTMKRFMDAFLELDQ